MRLAPVIDICALIIFALLANKAHPPFTLMGAVDAFWPWAVGALVGWLIVSYSPLRLRNQFQEFLIIWPSAIIIGMTLWTLVNGRFPHYSFLLVATIMSALLMFGWRALAHWRKITV